MEPKHLAPNAASEHLPKQTEAGGHEMAPPSFEIGDPSSPERTPEVRQEIGAVRAEAQQVAMPTLPAPVQPSDDTNGGATVADDTPLSAADDDLIEKEWVDKAKKILAETKDDPYRREQEVGKLQVEYIRKRYGREIGSVSSE